MFQRMTADEAALLVKDGDCICFNGQVRIAVAERFYQAIADRFSATGSPRKLRYIATSSYDGFNMWAPYQHDGLLDEIIVAHFGAISSFSPSILGNEIAAYSLPQGIIALNYDAAAARQPGFFSKVGLGTCVDPRCGTCGFNERSDRRFAEPKVIDGEEYLFFRTICPDVCVLRGTTCDPHGNITMEKEAGIMDPLTPAIAVHNKGGKVIVQVERFSEKHANPHDVRIPGFLVDAVYEEPNQVMTDWYDYDPVYAGEERIPDEEMPAFVDKLYKMNTEKRKTADKVIARRAAMEVRPEYRIMNLGLGIPMLLAFEAYRMGTLTENTALTLECGVGGGIPVGYTFAIVANPDIFMSQSDMFKIYQGVGLDMTGVGALEIDGLGNVNVIRKGDRLVGLGGFNDVTYGSKKIVVCSRFMVGSDVLIRDDGISFINGKKDKFVPKVDYVNLNAGLMRDDNRTVIYITERAVFCLGENGLVLTEIAPGADLEKDILSYLPFRPAISENLKVMPEGCFSVDEES